MRIGYISRRLLGEPLREAGILLHGSFLATGKGHGTDRALVAGLLGMHPDDVRIPQSLEIAQEKQVTIRFGGIELQDAHPNSVQLELTGDFVSQVMIRALAMGESNACMKAIVAAPTAGACGVLPTVLISYERKNGTSEDELIRAMAAGSLAYLQGGDEHQIIHAAAMALKNLLGLACDPVAGLVEVPCVKRNVVGAVNAVAACDMAMAGIQSAIPPDEVIDAMRGIGQVLPACIRETGEGGLAGTPTGKSVILN